MLLLELLEDGAELGRRLRFLLFVSASGGMQWRWRDQNLVCFLRLWTQVNTNIDKTNMYFV